MKRPPTTGIGIKAIQKINEQQKVVYAKAVNQDVHAFVQGSGDTCAVVLKFREERLVDKQDFFLGEVDSLPEAPQRIPGAVLLGQQRHPALNRNRRPI